MLPRRGTAVGATLRGAVCCAADQSASPARTPGAVSPGSWALSEVLPPHGKLLPRTGVRFL